MYKAGTGLKEPTSKGEETPAISLAMNQKPSSKDEPLEKEFPMLDLCTCLCQRVLIQEKERETNKEERLQGDQILQLTFPMEDEKVEEEQSDAMPPPARLDEKHELTFIDSYQLKAQDSKQNSDSPGKSLVISRLEEISNHRVQVNKEQLMLQLANNSTFRRRRVVWWRWRAVDVWWWWRLVVYFRRKRVVWWSCGDVDVWWWWSLVVYFKRRRIVWWRWGAVDVWWWWRLVVYFRRRRVVWWRRGAVDVWWWWRLVVYFRRGIVEKENNMVEVGSCRHMLVVETCSLL
ncbi:unnamed protein product [Thlaspi arvense]|uniref:Uncharacterized protein n=1 Tax=Thlaspi arvense TaxID=13288 RepID=A0AAU9STZ4_THLAR|nr:unnamed protein product [Thlaspi arvense]